MEYLQSLPEESILGTWTHSTTFSDWLVAPNGVIERSDSEAPPPPPPPKSVAGSSTFPNVSSPSPSIAGTSRQAFEPSDSGYSTPTHSYATATRLDGSRYPSGLSTPGMVGSSISTISGPSLPSTFLLPAAPLELDAEGNPIIPTPPHITGYPCPFRCLNCCDVSDSKSAWLFHIRSHFRPKLPPPTATCPFCHRTFNSPQPGTAYTSSETGWDQCMECLASHIEDGATLARPWKDTKLFLYLFQNKIIKIDDYRELMQEGQVYRGTPVIQFERRDRGRKGGRR